MVMHHGKFPGIHSHIKKSGSDPLSVLSGNTSQREGRGGYAFRGKQTHLDRKIDLFAMLKKTNLNYGNGTSQSTYCSYAIRLYCMFTFQALLDHTIVSHSSSSKCLPLKFLQRQVLLV